MQPDLSAGLQISEGFDPGRMAQIGSVGSGPLVDPAPVEHQQPVPRPRVVRGAAVVGGVARGVVVGHHLRLSQRHAPASMVESQLLGTRWDLVTSSLRQIHCLYRLDAVGARDEKRRSFSKAC